MRFEQSWVALTVHISCAMRIEDIDDKRSDLICLPEYTDLDSLKRLSTQLPDAIVVGAYQAGHHSRAYVAHWGHEWTDYLKVTYDGVTKGSGDSNQHPIYFFEDVCVGVLICMDIDDSKFSNAVIDEMKSSEKRWKILCVPADMSKSWFNSDELPVKFKGINVVLSNNISHQNNRCLSFIANDQREMIVRQSEFELISATLPFEGSAMFDRQ